MDPEALPAIVIAAYDRPDGLQRILKGIAKANFSKYSGKNIPLIISIDYSDNSQIKHVAETFYWGFGEKKIISHSEHLGLRRNILYCGSLTNEYGSIILLEDDLQVSPVFYDYACQAAIFFGKDKKIAGISLYGYDFCEHAQLRFQAIDDGYDNYFMQTPSSWGQLWNNEQWNMFMQWYEENNNIPLSKEDKLPENVISWSDKSWKKYFIKYMVENQLFFVFPRFSLTTNSSHTGSHHLGFHNNYQVSLSLGTREYHFKALQDSYCVYDCYFELLPYCYKKLSENLTSYDFEVDLYGIKRLEDIKTPYFLSTKMCTHPIASWSLNLIPQELNVIYEETGNVIHLGIKENFTKRSKKTLYLQLLNLHKNFGWKNYFVMAFIVLYSKLKQVRKIINLRR